MQWLTGFRTATINTPGRKGEAWELHRQLFCTMMTFAGPGALHPPHTQVLWSECSMFATLNAILFGLSVPSETSNSCEARAFPIHSWTHLAVNWICVIKAQPGSTHGSWPWAKIHSWDDVPVEFPIFSKMINFLLFESFIQTALYYLKFTFPIERNFVFSIHNKNTIFLSLHKHIMSIFKMEHISNTL